MKPLPNLADEAAMLLRGKRSALAAARNETESAIRDSYTALQSTDWAGLADHAARIGAMAERLQEIAAMWDGITSESKT